MFGLDNLEGLFNQAGGWLEDLGEFAQDAQSVYQAVQGFGGSGSGGSTPGIVPLGAGIGPGPVQGPPDPSAASGLVMLGLAAVAVFLILRKG